MCASSACRHGAGSGFQCGEPAALLPWFGRFFATYYTHGQFHPHHGGSAGLHLLLGAAYGNVLLFWAVPALLALAQLFVFGTYLPHRHGEDEFADEHRARSISGSAIVSLLTCFHFGGYHHEHHLSPGTAWWQLPRFRREREASGRS
jgi:beta-carotene ketolase (CrtW type)